MYLMPTFFLHIPVPSIGAIENYQHCNDNSNAAMMLCTTELSTKLPEYYLDFVQHGSSTDVSEASQPPAFGDRCLHPSCCVFPHKQQWEMSLRDADNLR